jgi:hypothetical protein
MLVDSAVAVGYLEALRQRKNAGLIRLRNVWSVPHRFGDRLEVSGPEAIN